MKSLSVIYTCSSGLGQGLAAFGQKPSPSSQYQRAGQRYSSEEVKRLELERTEVFAQATFLELVSRGESLDHCITVTHWL